MVPSKVCYHLCSDEAQHQRNCLVQILQLAHDCVDKSKQRPQTQDCKHIGRVHNERVGCDAKDLQREGAMSVNGQLPPKEAFARAHKSSNPKFAVVTAPYALDTNQNEA